MEQFTELYFIYQGSPSPTVRNNGSDGWLHFLFVPINSNLEPYCTKVVPDTYRDYKMKKTLLLLLCIDTILFASCSPMFSNYQIASMKAVGCTTEDASSIVFEDENCKVMYNLWCNSGDAGFLIYNKSDQNLYLDMTESFFVKNGRCFSYYKNRSYTETKAVATGSRMTTTSTTVNGNSNTNTNSSMNSYNYLPNERYGYLTTNSNTNAVMNFSTVGFSNTYSSTRGSSVSIAEEKIVCIAPNTYRIITEYSISDNIYRSCDLLLKGDDKNENNPLTFTEENSPLVFENIISYRVGESKTLNKMKTKFYMNEVVNKKASAITELRRPEFCGESFQEMKKERYFTNYDARKFYIEYDLKYNKFKH